MFLCWDRSFRFRLWTGCVLFTSSFADGLILIFQSPFTSWFTLAATVVTSSAFSANIVWMLREQITAWISPAPPSTSSSGLEKAFDQRVQFYHQQILSTSNPMFSSSDIEQLVRGRPRMTVLRNPLGRPVTTTISLSSVKDETESMLGDPNDSPRMEYHNGEKTQMVRPTLVCYGNLKAFGALRDFKCSPDGKYLATMRYLQPVPR